MTPSARRTLAAAFALPVIALLLIVLIPLILFIFLILLLCGAAVPKARIFHFRRTPEEPSPEDPDIIDIVPTEVSDAPAEKGAGSHGDSPKLRA